MESDTYMKHAPPILSMVTATSILWSACTSSSPALHSDHRSRQPGTTSPAVAQDRYSRDIQPILSNRCVVCHTCVDAPCQLHLESYFGLRRGATFSEMGASLFETIPTRLKDADTLQEWRQRGFFPIVRDTSGRNDPTEAKRNLEESILYQFISLGHRHNRPAFDLAALDDHREQDNSCVGTIDQFKRFAKKFPAAGMPYGLPALDPVSFETLQSWIADGAPGPSEQAARALAASSQPEVIEEWESILNGTPKARLTGRFIYEHAFSAHIHFEDTPGDEFYELVRSRTRFPAPVEEIVTPRPYDPPGAAVHYRFRRVNQTIVRKTHILWELGRADLIALKQLFLETPWGPHGDPRIVDPGYSSTNPFEYFAQIPAEIRYKFMLQNSRLLVNAMVRGPVCDGKEATHAIRDNFWVFFIKPSSDVTVKEPNIGYYEWSHLGSKLNQAMNSHSRDYITAMRKHRPQGFSVDDIWTGDGNNPNAVLTILRHETSVTVHYGPQGGQPPTFWVLNFSNLERIYYNLVVDYKPWGNMAHKLATWEYMSYHRQEGEERFISFLPPAFRDAVRSSWTSGLGSFENFFKKKYSSGISSQVNVNKNLPVESLVDQLLSRMPAAVLSKVDKLSPYPKRAWDIPVKIRTIQDWEQALAAISGKVALKFAQHMPNIVFIRLEDRPYTLITHRAYSFDNIPGVVDFAADPIKDRVAAFQGLYGDIPELFFDLNLAQADNFIGDLHKVTTPYEWMAFKELYALRRNNPQFWSLLDWFHQWDRLASPLESGIFDVSEYDIDE